MKLGTRYVLLMSIMLLAMLISLTMIYNFYIIPWNMQTMVNKSEGLAYYLNDSWQYMDNAEKQEFLENIKYHDPDVTYLLFVDNDGKALYHSDPTRVGMYFNDTGTLKAAKYGQKNQQIYTRDISNISSPYHGEKVVDILLPYHNSTGALNGALNVGVSLQRIEDQKKLFHMLLIINGAFIFVVIFVLTKVHFEDVLKPLENITYAVRNMKKGEYELNIPKRRNDELGEVIDEMNNMSSTISSLMKDLKKRETELEEYIDHLITLNGKLSPDGSVLMVNYTAVDLIRKDKSDIIGKKFWESYWWDFSQEQADILKEQIQRASRGESVRIEAKNRIYGEKIIDIDLSIKPVIGINGKVSYLVVEGREISDRKKAETELKESEMNLAKAQHLSRLGSWVIDLNTYNVKWSDELYRIFGISPRSMPGSKDLYLAYVHPEDRDLVSRSIRIAVTERKGFKTDHRIITADGSLKFVQCEGDIILDKNFIPVAIIGATQDITGRKVAENMLRDAKTQAELYVDLMSHDINNMNQAAMGYLELYLYPAGPTEDDMIHKSLDIIRNSSILIDNVKKLKYIQSGNVPIKSVDLDDVLLKTKEKYLATPDRNVIINYTPKSDRYVGANELLIDVFDNIVGNSIKHSTGPITVDITVNRIKLEERSCYKVTIDDNGPGIPDIQKQRMFTYPYGTEPLVRRGIGLQLVKALVTAFNGKILAEDRVLGDHTKGCRFIIILPAWEVTNTKTYRH